VANTFTISTIFKGFDHTTKVAKGISKNLEGLSRVVKRVAMIGIAALGVVTGLVAREYINFDQAIKSASAKFKGLNLATKEGQEILKQLGKTARDVGAATQFTAAQAAEGLDFLALAGFNAGQAMASLPGVVDLATVSQVDLSEATSMAADSLGAFNFMAEDTIQLQKNFSRMNDVLAKTISSTNTGMTDLFEAIKTGAPTFTSAGQSLETFASMAGIMANSGVKGSAAGTGLRNVMLRLAAPSAEAEKVLRKLNIRTRDASGNFLDAVDILGQFEKSLEGMGTAQRTAALSTIFGARSVTGVNVLLTAGTKSIRKFRDELINAGGAAKGMSDVIRQSLLNRLKTLKSAAIEVGFQFFEKIEVQAGEAIEKLTKILRDLPIEKYIKGIGEAFDFIFPFIKAAWEVFLDIKDVLPYVAAGLGITAAAMWALSAATLANPMGIFVAGLWEIAIATIVIKRYWTELNKILRDAWNALNDIFNNPVLKIAMATFFAPFEFLLDTIRAIIDLLSGKGIGDALMNFAGPFKVLTDLLGITKPGGKALAHPEFARPEYLKNIPETQSPYGEGGPTPMSPNETLMKAMATIKETRGKLDVNFNNTPPGTKIKSSGTVSPDIGLNLGPSFVTGL